MSEISCLNCQGELLPAQKFCPQCGQKADTHRIGFGHFVHDFFHAFTHTDKGIFHLLKGLATRPGIVASEYLAGQRKKYFNPFTFFLILAGIYVFSNTMFSNPQNQFKPNDAVLAKIPSEQGRQRYLTMSQRGYEVNQFMTKHGNILAMIAVPILSFIAWIFFRKKKYNYPEHLTANLMFVTFSNLVFTLLVHPLQALYRGEPGYLWLVYGGLMLQVIYYTWSYYQLEGYHSFGKLLKSFFVSLFAIAFWSALTMTFIALYIYRNSHFYEFFTQGRR